MAIDPVCLMEVDEATAQWTSEYKGQTYYFCAPGCKVSFDEDPEKYLSGGEGHNHAMHESHDHEAHSGHDHAMHEGDDHEPHSGHDEADHERSSHSDHDHTQHRDDHR